MTHVYVVVLNFDCSNTPGSLMHEIAGQLAYEDEDEAKAECARLNAELIEEIREQFTELCPEKDDEDDEEIDEPIEYRGYDLSFPPTYGILTLAVK